MLANAQARARHPPPDHGRSSSASDGQKRRCCQRCASGARNAGEGAPRGRASSGPGASPPPRSTHDRGDYCGGAGSDDPARPQGHPHRSIPTEAHADNADAPLKPSPERADVPSGPRCGARGHSQATRHGSPRDPAPKGSRVPCGCAACVIGMAAGARSDAPHVTSIHGCGSSELTTVEAPKWPAIWASGRAPLA